MLKYLRKNGCPWNEGLCENAALGGHLEVLKWARENERPWDESTCSAAAYRGHLEVLKWARANGCSWDRDKCLEFARVKTKNNIVNWILTSERA